MFCTDCGSQLPASAAFCPTCGAATTKPATPPPAPEDTTDGSFLDWFALHPVWTAVIIIVGVGLIISAIASSSNGNSASGSPVPNGAVGGTLGTGNSHVTADEVWCRWSPDDSHVIMHIRFHNTGVEDVNINVITRYTVVNGGTHGDSNSNVDTTDVPADTTVVANDDAGSPAGVTPGSPLGSCEPYTD